MRSALVISSVPPAAAEAAAVTTATETLVRLYSGRDREVSGESAWVLPADAKTEIIAF